MWIDFFALASSVWNRIRAREDRPSDGALMTTKPHVSLVVGSGPGVRHGGKYSSPERISSDDSSQLSAKHVCNPVSRSPCTLHTVSRQRGSFGGEPFHHTSEIPAPPMNP